MIYPGHGNTTAAKKLKEEKRLKMANTMNKKSENMTLMELQGIFGDRIKMTLRDDLTPEERQIENEESALIMNIGKQMINNADLILRFEKLQAETKNLKESRMTKIVGGK